MSRENDPVIWAVIHETRYNETIVWLFSYEPTYEQALAFAQPFDPDRESLTITQTETITLDNSDKDAIKHVIG